MTAIHEPGLYDCDDATYQTDPCETISLRSSLAWVMHDKTPAHAAFACPRLNPEWRPEGKREFDIGKAAHALLLGRGADFAIVHAPNYRSRDARDFKEQIIASGKTPLLDAEAAQVRAMAAAAKRQIAEMIAAGTIPHSPFLSAHTEKVLVWEDHRVLCRAMLDGLSIDGDIVSEYKTEGQSAAPAQWQWKARKLGYIFRLAFYRRGLQALKLAYSPEFHIFVQETDPPYLLAFYRVDDELIARADADVVAVLKRWRRCLETNMWPGYSTEGYELGLLDRERVQEAADAPRTEHVTSEDIASNLKVTPLLRRK